MNRAENCARTSKGCCVSECITDDASAGGCLEVHLGVGARRRGLGPGCCYRRGPYRRSARGWPRGRRRWSSRGGATDLVDGGRLEVEALPARQQDLEVEGGRRDEHDEGERHPAHAQVGEEVHQRVVLLVRISFCVITGPGQEEADAADRILNSRRPSATSARRGARATSSPGRIAEKVVRRTASAASTSTPKTIRPPSGRCVAAEDLGAVERRAEGGVGTSTADENLIRAKSVISVYPWGGRSARGCPAHSCTRCAPPPRSSGSNPLCSAVTSIITSTPALVNAAFLAAFFASHSAVLSTKWMCAVRPP